MVVLHQRMFVICLWFVWISSKYLEYRIFSLKSHTSGGPRILSSYSFCQHTIRFRCTTLRPSNFLYWRNTETVSTKEAEKYIPPLTLYCVHYSFCDIFTINSFNLYDIWLNRECVLSPLHISCLLIFSLSNTTTTWCVHFYANRVKTALEFSFNCVSCIVLVIIERDGWLTVRRPTGYMTNRLTSSVFKQNRTLIDIDRVFRRCYISFICIICNNNNFVELCKYISPWYYFVRQLCLLGFRLFLSGGSLPVMVNHTEEQRLSCTIMTHVSF